MNFMLRLAACTLTLCCFLGASVAGGDSASFPPVSDGYAEFASPPASYRPETWFHLIGGNVAKEGLTVDLEAVAAAGLSGIQLFHGSGRAWPGVSPQIQTLSPAWDGMIEHVANETRRLGLRFTMQNCPGWAMSGGPWITPDRAMRHLIWSREDVAGGSEVSVSLPQPQPSGEDWRDYRDVAVVAFPTPLDDDGGYLSPARLESNRPELPWADLFDETKRGSTRFQFEPSAERVWLEVYFDEAVTLRSVELPPTDFLALRRVFDPQISVRIQAITTDGLVEVATREVPRGNWQDKDWDERPLLLALPDFAATGYRITFENDAVMGLRYLRLSEAARVRDWQGQAGYVLRSLDFGPRPAQDPATWVRSSSVVDLSGLMDSAGRLTWDAPAGRWTVLRLGHVNTGTKNKPAPPEATGFECDKLSPLGAEQHFAGYIGRVSAPGGPADGGRLQGMLIDSWECFTQSWTPAMEEEFSERRGYGLRRFFPALAGWVVDDHETSERFLRDWRATISDLLVDNYFGRLASLARERGMALSFETAMGDVAVGDILQYYKEADIVMAEFWQPNDPRDGGIEQKPIFPAASAARIYGKSRVAAEAFTQVPLRWDEHPFMLKHFADKHFALGVNHMVFHTYTHNPRLDVAPGTSFGGRIGSPFIRGQTWWEHMSLFTDYLARCGYLLQQGSSVADVLWYLGDAVDHKPRQDAPFPVGYKFDYVNADALVSRISVEDGQLRTPEGTAWKVLWLRPENNRRLSVATLERLRELIEDGATVIGPAPEENASLVGGDAADKAFEKLVAELWGKDAAASGDRRIGKGRLIWGQELGATLRALGIDEDVRGAKSAAWSHRLVDGSDLYFIAADRKATFEANLSFRAVGRPVLMDPLTGESTEAIVFKREGERTVVPIRLPAAGSVFLRFAPEAGEPSVTRIEKDGAVFVDAGDVRRVDTGVPDGIQGLSRQETIQPWIDEALAPLTLDRRGEGFVAWENGTYRFARDDEWGDRLEVSGARQVAVDGPWTLAFPEGWGTVGSVELAEVGPWSALEPAETRSFSGTATYRSTVELGALGEDEVCLLDLGRVAVIAKVRVNGEHVSTLWAPPFRVDISEHVRPGANAIEVAVTNTWFNRLRFDEGLPEDQRKTWSIFPPAADSPVELSGLVGPVSIRQGVRVAVGD